MTVVSKSAMREPELWQAVGNTPLLSLELPPGHGRIYLKAVNTDLDRAVVRARQHGRGSGPASGESRRSG